MEVNGCCQLSGHQHSSKYRIMCLKELRNSYMFWNSIRVSNDDIILFLGGLSQADI